MTNEPEVALLEVLTDEELAVLTDTHPVAVTPHLSLRSPKERGPLVETAYRSLVARGIITPPTAEARARARAELAQARAEAAEAARPGHTRATSRDVTVDVAIREDVSALITLRRSARRVVAMARTTSAQQDYVYVYLVDDVALVEIVSNDGFHRFSLVRRDDVPVTVAQAALHAEAADGYGEPVDLGNPADGDPTPGEAMLEQAGEALLRCDLTVLDAENPHPEMLGIFSSPRGSWLMRAAWGTSEGVSAYPVTVAALHDAVTAALAGA